MVDSFYRTDGLPPFNLQVFNADKLRDTDMLLLEYTSGECINCFAKLRFLSTEYHVVPPA